MPQINMPSLATGASQGGANAVLASPADTQNAMQYATAGFRGGQEARQENTARRQQAETKQMEGYKAMLGDPQNADAIARMYGIPMTETLRGMLAKPMLLKNIVMAQEWGSKMGIKNPEAMQAMMMEAAKQAQQGVDFNPVAIMGSTQGMDMGEQMNPYQQAQIGIQQQNADTMADYRTRMADAATTRAQPKPTDLWNNPALSPALRIEGRALGSSDFVDPEQIADWERRAMADLASKQQTGVPQGGMPGGAAPGAAPATPAPAVQQPAVPGAKTYQQLWGD